MHETLPRLDRRGAIRLFAAFAATSGGVGAACAAEKLPEGAVLLVAGPDGGRLDRWASLFTSYLGRFLPTRVGVRKDATGAVDGVTGANQFGARAMPDGTMLLLVPGRAILSWLCGDPRARFDAAGWVPVLAGIRPAVLVGRVRADELRPGDRLSIAAATPDGPDLPALLGLDLAGIRPEPIFGLSEPGAVQAALTTGSVDMALLHGNRVPERAAVLAGSGVRPICTLGAMGAGGGWVRDPAFPDLPTFPELAVNLRGTPPDGPLYAAWGAAASATRLDFALVLPPLTPAGMIAMWRRASSQSAAAPEVLAASEADQMRAQTVSATTSAIAALNVDTTVLVELRRWLAARFDWHPA